MFKKFQINKYWILSICLLCTIGLSFLIIKTTNLDFPLTQKINKIITITASGKENFPPSLFAELLGLDKNSKPVNKRAFIKHAYQIFKNFPAIEKCSINFKSSSLVINYTPRTPIAQLEDFSNTLIDKSGICFPSEPFFHPKRLPKIFLGSWLLQNDNPWNQYIPNQELAITLNMLSLLEKEDVELIDVSGINASSSGRREIVILTGSKTFLRVSVKSYSNDIKKYFIIKNNITKNLQIVDLRINNSALIKTVP